MSNGYNTTIRCNREHFMLNIWNTIAIFFYLKKKSRNAKLVNEIRPLNNEKFVFSHAVNCSKLKYRLFPHNLLTKIFIR